MAYKIIWSSIAREDLRLIVSFLRRSDPLIAARIGNRLIDRVDVLPSFPRLGRRVPEFMDDTVRELIERPYRIVYRVNDQSGLIVIVRIWHGARGEPEVPDIKE